MRWSTSTWLRRWPSGFRSVAVCQERATVIAPVAVNAPTEDWPGADAAHQSRSIKAVFISIHSDSDHIAWAAEIVQPDWNRRPGRDAGRNPNIDLAQSRESRSLAEPEHFREMTADRYLWRNDGSL